MLSGSITPDDYATAMRLDRKKTAAVIRMVMIAISLIGIGVAIWSSTLWGNMLIYGGICGFIGDVWTSRSHIPRMAAKRHAQYKELSNVVTYEWNDEIIEGRSESGYGKKPWKNYARFREDGDIFILYMSDGVFEMFPKRWFLSPEQIAEFRRLASAAGT